MYVGRNAKNEFFFRENAHAGHAAGVVKLKCPECRPKLQQVQILGRKAMPSGDMTDPTYGQFSEDSFGQSVQFAKLLHFGNCA